MPIEVSGYPLPGKVTIRNPRPETDDERTGWLLDVEQAVHLLDAWKHAPGGDTDVCREWVHYDVGLFVTVLYLDGEISISSWELYADNDGTVWYPTMTMPFNFIVTERPDRPPAERFRLTDTDPNP